MTQKHKPKHVRPNTGWLAAIAWLLTCTFFGMSYYYALLNNELTWVVWFVIGWMWLYVSITETTKYLKTRRNF